MKTLNQVQMAHDILKAVLNGEVPPPGKNPNVDHLMPFCDVLCWMLDDECSSPFQRLLDRIVTKLADKGYKLKRSPVPFTGPRPGNG